MKTSNSMFFIISFFIIIVLILFLSYKVMPSTNSKSDNFILTEGIIDDYFSDDINKKANSIDKIKEIVLYDLGFENWMEYKEYMDILIFPTDLENNPDIDIIIGLNLSKDTGLIAIYTKENSNYVLNNFIKDLSYIDYISTYEVNDEFFLAVEETIDEKLGGYFYDEKLVIYYKEESFNKVFEDSKIYESYFYEGWKKEDIKNPKWFKLTENNIIDIIEDKDNIKIKDNKELKLYVSEESSTSIPSNFDEYKSKKFNLNYFWDKDLNYFIQNRGILVDSGELIGIVSISNQNIDYYLDNQEVTYKIIDQKGNIRHESLDKIRVLN
ncbi:hypothetical protein [Senegalia massiliensis]|uniref:hypothetical protein n=1 Tax=Senegalia massiliensis TaxID=1720316 RepID=UPI001031D1D4|nr:hypothetical protein [Senegalia massiliensis]